MKKGVFSVMHYLQPVKFGQLSLHSPAIVGMEKENVTLLLWQVSLAVWGLLGVYRPILTHYANR